MFGLFKNKETRKERTEKTLKQLGIKINALPPSNYPIGLNTDPQTLSRGRAVKLFLPKTAYSNNNKQI